MSSHSPSTRLHKVIRKLIRPVKRLMRMVSHSKDGRPLTDKQRTVEQAAEIGTAAFFPSDPTPLHSPPVRTSSSNQTRPEAEESPQTSKTVTPETTVRPRCLTTSHKSVKAATPSPPVHNVVHRTSSTTSHSSSFTSTTSAPRSSSLSSWNTQETDLTGRVRLHQSHKIYDGPYSIVYQGIYDDGSQEEDVCVS